MLMRLRTVVGSAILVCGWSCQVWGKDLATIYSSLPEPDPGESLSHVHDPRTRPFALSAPVAWAYRLDGTQQLQRESYLAWVGIMQSAGAPVPDLELDYGGMPGSDRRSYFNMVARGSAVIVGFELALFGVMLMLPREAMKWEDDFIQDAAQNLGQHLVSAPVWDEDDWRLNYLGHPYAGSIYYNTVRAQGASPWQSFLFALGASTFWEYAVEGTAEPASTQDLIVTPVAGALLGEAVHHLTLQLKKGGTSFLEGVIITILNPTHVVMKGYH